MSERGVFAVDRGIWDHDLLADSSPFSRREAWLWLVSEAAWKPHRRRLAGKVIDLGRGQFAGSLRFIASKWRWSEPRVRRFLHALISDAMIDAKTDAGITVVTICNYDDYQRVSLPSDATPEVKDDAPATQERRKVEDKEDKESIKKEISPKSDWPEDFREQFWAAYPRHVARKAAFKKLETIKKSGEVTFQALLSAVRSMPAAEERFIPHPTTWLNEGRYLDAALPILAPTGPPKPPAPNLPSDDELRKRYAQRREDAGTAAEGPRVLEGRVGFHSEDADGLGLDRSRERGISGLAGVFPLQRMEAVCRQGRREENDQGHDDAEPMARVV